MITAYMFYNKHRVAEIKLESGYRHEARHWADQLYEQGISVFVGRYSVKFACWRWIKYIPGVEINLRQLGCKQPEPYRSVNKTDATM